MRAILMICRAVLATPAAAGERQPLSTLPVNGTAVMAPQPGATVHRFGSGALIERPGQPVQTVAPFGSGVIVSEPGRPSVVCSPFGSKTVCR
jgi:hypothetical protein